MKILVVLFLVAAVFSTSKYKVTSVNQLTSGYVIGLTYTGNETSYLRPDNLIIKDLVFTLTSHTASDLSFKITDVNKTRFEVPQYGVFPIDPVKNFTFPLTNSLFQFSFTQNPFDFSIIRKFDNEVMFDTSKGEIIFSDHYLEITTRVTSNNIFGFGQRFSSNFKIKPGTYTIFNRDRGQVIDRGNGMQTYGYYPVYLIRENAGNYHLNYFRSSNALDVVVKEASINQYTLTYKSIGGVIDFRFFASEKNPEAAIEKFQLYMGRSTVPPFWSLGFHQCRWGYENITMLENMIKGYESNNIPLDIVWSDIDYMIDYEDFTIDETRFPLDRMAAITNKYRYVPIIDAGISIKGEAYQEGLKRNVFMKEADGKTPFIGKVWPGETGFVDFFAPNASTYWSDMLQKLYNKVKFSGIWLDMNEIANFCDGACNATSTPKKFDYSKDLPYTPGGGNIEDHTVSLNATHYGGLEQANVHAYFGFLESQATYYYLLNRTQRPFIITRSSTLGSNKYAFHWTGDNYANFQFLRSSITDNFLFQMWGIQMVGADICGFGGNTTQQLCARWFQLGSFYPFSRNHNDKQSRSQEAYALGDTVMSAARTNLKLRYSLLKFYYRHFINKRGLGTIFRPLFIDYPNDANVLTDEVAETQFAVGGELMFAPILVENTTYRSVYLPQGNNWFDYHSGKMYKGGDMIAIQNQLTDPVPIFIREGTGVMSQRTENVTKTSQLGNVFTLKAGLGFNSRNSTAETKKYEALIGFLSIKDFNDESKIALCLRDGCQFSILAVLSITGNRRSLQLDVFYNGLNTLREEQLINRLQLHYDGGKVVQDIQQVSITNAGKITINIDQQVQ